MRRKRGFYRLFSDCDAHCNRFEQEMEPIHKFNNKKNEEVIISKPKQVAKAQSVESGFCDHGNSISLSFSHDFFDEIQDNKHTYVDQQSYDEYADDLDYYVEPFENDPETDESSGKQKTPIGEDLNEQISGEKEPEKGPDLIKDQEPQKPDLIEPEPNPLPVFPEPPKRMPVLPEDDKEIIPLGSVSDFESDIQDILKGKKDYESFQEKVDPETAQQKKSQQKISKANSVDDPFYTGEHGIFEKIAQNMALANSYDLGAISLEQRFDSFEDEMEEEEKEEKTVQRSPQVKNASSPDCMPSEHKKVLAQQAPLSNAVSTNDFLEDLDEIAFANRVSAGLTTSLRSRIDQYYNDANYTYTLPSGGNVKAFPVFTYGTYVKNNNILDPAKAKFKKQLGTSTYNQLKTKIVHSIYGRSKPSIIGELTQKLIDSGVSFKPTTDGIRELQNEYNIGIDCAGYVQLSFFHSIHGHDNDTKDERLRLGLKERRGSEKLNSLSRTHFDKIPFADAQTGDLMILKPRSGEIDSHTVIIVDHTHSGSIHSFLVDASWGTDAYGSPKSGVNRRTFQYNTATKKWGDIDPNTNLLVHENPIGPYQRHPLLGVFRKNKRFSPTR